MPQKDPEFYDLFIKTFNVPEFVQGPVQISESALKSAIYDSRKEVRPQQQSTAQSAGTEPYYSSGRTRNQ